MRLLPFSIRVVNPVLEIPITWRDAEIYIFRETELGVDMLCCGGF
jgi:hypothetical protein